MRPNAPSDLIATTLQPRVIGCGYPFGRQRVRRKSIPGRQTATRSAESVPHDRVTGHLRWPSLWPIILPGRRTMSVIELRPAPKDRPPTRVRQQIVRPAHKDRSPMIQPAHKTAAQTHGAAARADCSPLESVQPTESMVDQVQDRGEDAWALIIPLDGFFSGPAGARFPLICCIRPDTVGLARRQQRGRGRFDTPPGPQAPCCAGRIYLYGLSSSTVLIQVP